MLLPPVLALIVLMVNREAYRAVGSVGIAMQMRN